MQMCEMQMNESVEFVDATCSSPLATPTIQYNTKRRTCLLRDIGIRRKADLTPRKEKLFAVARTMIKKVNLMSKKNLSYKQQIKFAKKFVTSDSCNNLSEKLINLLTRIHIYLHTNTHTHTFTYVHTLHTISYT